MSWELFTPLSSGIQQYFLYFSRFRVSAACITEKRASVIFHITHINQTFFVPHQLTDLSKAVRPVVFKCQTL